MNISFLLYFWKEKNYLIYCIKKTTNYIVSWLFTKKKHHARYVCQSVLYNGESRNSNYDDLFWVHGPRVGNWSWQRAWVGTSSKNRLESPLIYIYIYIYSNTPPRLIHKYIFDRCLIVFITLFTRDRIFAKFRFWYDSCSSNNYLLTVFYLIM